jgi:hypothetical protein
MSSNIIKILGECLCQLEGMTPPLFQVDTNASDFDEGEE